MENEVSTEDYGKAVVRLTRLAKGDTGGAKAAAQVILSAFNGFNFQLDVTDLCSLDGEHFEDAITVIRGRKQLSKEPHHQIENGPAIFVELCEQWKHLHVDRRNGVIG